jgi:hypothetical protein
MNYSANKMAAKHCLSAQCIVVDIVPLIEHSPGCGIFQAKINAQMLSKTAIVRRKINFWGRLYKKVIKVNYN